MEDNIKRNAIKIAMLGDSKVGKTAICNAFMNMEFEDDYNLATIGMEKLEVPMTLKNGENIKLIIWDTAGQERFHSLALSTIKTAQGTVIVFDFTCKKSFDNVVNWLKEVDEKLNKPSVALFGNKTDLPEDKWEVTRKEAEKFAKERKMKFFETTAKLNKGIKEGFEYIVNLAYETSEGSKGISLNKKKSGKSKCCGGGGNKKKTKKK